MPADPPPDEDAQKAILAKTNQYVNTTINRLPNFYATRRTERFEASPSHVIIEPPSVAFAQANRSGSSTGVAPDVPMHSIGTSKVAVTYRDGYELKGSKKLDFKVAHPTPAPKPQASSGPSSPSFSTMQLTAASRGVIGSRALSPLPADIQVRILRPSFAIR